MIARVTVDSGVVEATIEIELGSAPPSGRLTAADRPSLSFSGWMELAAALDALCSPPAVAREPQTRRNEP